MGEGEPPEFYEVEKVGLYRRALGEILELLEGNSEAAVSESKRIAREALEA